MICPISDLGHIGGVYYYDGMDCDTMDWWPMSSHSPLQLGCPGDNQNCWPSDTLRRSTPEHILMHGLGQTGLKKPLARTDGFPSHAAAEVLDTLDCEFRTPENKPYWCRLFLIKTHVGGKPRYHRIGFEVEIDPQAPRPPMADGAEPLDACAYRVTYGRIPFTVLTTPE
jgi:hypothetical protein